MLRKTIRATRHGASAIQTATVLALIAVVVVMSVAGLGTSTSDELEKTATDVIDPASLKSRFGPKAESDSGHGDPSPN